MLQSLAGIPTFFYLHRWSRALGVGTTPDYGCLSDLDHANFNTGNVLFPGSYCLGGQGQPPIYSPVGATMPISPQSFFLPHAELEAGLPGSRWPTDQQSAVWQAPSVMGATHPMASFAGIEDGEPDS